jgi:hypothetical protein
MAINYGPTAIATPTASGLVLKVDASITSSYSGTGTTWTDLSGNGNHMTIAGSPTFTKIGNLGYFTLVGSDITRYMIINPFSHPTTAATVEMWLLSDASYANADYFISYEVTGAGNNNLYGVPINIALFNAGGSVSSSVNIKDNTWKHFVASSNRTTGEVILYINGTRVFSSTILAGTNFTSGGALMLGQEQDSQGGGLDANQSFKGFISSFSLFNRVLTAKEVTNLYLFNKNKFGL